MLDCPNKKCGSQMPNTFRYCIYCSAKLPDTEQNKKQVDKGGYSLLQIGVFAASVLLILLFAVAVFMLKGM